MIWWGFLLTKKFSSIQEVLRKIQAVVRWKRGTKQARVGGAMSKGVIRKDLPGG